MAISMNFEKYSNTTSQFENISTLNKSDRQALQMLTFNLLIAA